MNVPILPSSISIFSGEKPDEVIDKHIMGSIVGFYFIIEDYSRAKFARTNVINA